MPQARIFRARSVKESFKRRRKGLLNKAALLRQDDAQVFIVVRQSDNFYTFNSEKSEEWMNQRNANIQPLCRTGHDTSDKDDEGKCTETSTQLDTGRIFEGNERENDLNLRDSTHTIGNTGPQLITQNMDQDVRTMSSSGIDFGLDTSFFLANDRIGSNVPDHFSPFPLAATPEFTNGYQTPPARRLPCLTPPVLRQSQTP